METNLFFFSGKWAVEENGISFLKEIATARGREKILPTGHGPEQSTYKVTS